MTDKQLELLVRKAGERRRRQLEAEADRMTIAVATGYSIARSKDARRAWETARARRGHVAAQTPGEFRATLSRLAAMFPGQVRIH